MAVTTINIILPFSFTEKSVQEIKITNQTSVKNIIKSLLPSGGLNPDDYGIYIRPHKKWLLPGVLLQSYMNSINTPQITYEFRPRILKIVKINVSFHQITTYCDPQQPIAIVIQNSISKLIPSYSTAEFSAENIFDGQYFNSSEPISNILKTYPKSNEIPIILSRREIPKKENSSNFIFKSTIDNALLREHNEVKVPSFFTKLLELIDKNKDSVGIYRLSGDFTTIEEICKFIDNTADNDKINSYLSQQKPNELACVVKQYLRQLDEPVIPAFFEKEFRDVIIIDDFITRIQKLKVLVKSLPHSHYNLLLEFCRHIERIIQSPINQMGSKNLSICIGTNIIRAQNPLTVVQDTQSSQLIVQTIFENWRFIFLDEKINLNSNKGTIITDITDNESGKSLQKQTKVVIIEKNNENSDDEIWTVKSGDIIIKTSSKNVQLNDPIFIEPFHDYIPFSIDTTISDNSYLMPDDPKHVLADEDLHKIIEAKTLEAQDIEKKLDEILQKLANDPNNPELIMELRKLHERFSKI